MDEGTARRVWGAMITAGSYAFNYAHSHSYSMLGYWCAWLKAHHPTAFYAASLSKMGGSTGSGAKIPKEEQLIRDAVRHGILVLPPDPQKSKADWHAIDGKRIIGGFKQIEGIAEKTAQSILDYRAEHGLTGWDDLVKIKGIGVKTVDKVKDFVAQRDPYGILRLEEAITAVRSELGDLGLPEPTHTAAEVPYERGVDTQIVWLGIIVHRNLRDIFETNRARTGEELKPEEVKRPELNEFLLAEGYDGDEIVNIRFNRFVYPRFRKAIWGLKVGADLVLIQGVKPGWRTAREIYVRNMWVLDPETD
jgi:DNA polymerase-3 subunit alpha